MSQPLALPRLSQMTYLDNCGQPPSGWHPKHHLLVPRLASYESDPAMAVHAGAPTHRQSKGWRAKEGRTQDGAEGHAASLGPRQALSCPGRNPAGPAAGSKDTKHM